MKRGGKETDTERVELLIRQGEGLTVEMKERYTPRIPACLTSFGAGRDEDLAAFSNSRGGTLLLGVRDDGTIAGERLTNDLKAKITDLARNCKPPISVSLAQVGEVVAVEVPEGSDKPYSCGSGFFRAIFRRSPKFALKEGKPGSEKTGKEPGEKSSKKTRVKAGEKILDLIRSNPAITMAELAEAVILTVKGVEWNIRRLKEQGRLRRVGPDKGGRWEVVK